MSNKVKKMKQNKAGYYIPAEIAAEIIRTIEDRKVDPEFINGAACVLSYLICSEGSEDYGMEFPEYLDNGLKAMEEPPAEVLSAAREVIETLKAYGVEVVDAYIVSRGDL